MTEVVNGTLRLIGNRMLIKPLDWDASKTIIAIRHGRPVRGEVVAIGPGEHPKKYKAQRSKFDYAKRFQPTEVKPGEIVELGGLNQYDGKGYQFTEILYNGFPHLICSEKDVCVVRDDLKGNRLITRQELLKGMAESMPARLALSGYQGAV